MKPELLQNKEVAIIKMIIITSQPGGHPEPSPFRNSCTNVLERRSRGSVQIALPATAKVGMVLWDAGASPRPLYNPQQHNQGGHCLYQHKPCPP